MIMRLRDFWLKTNHIQNFGKLCPAVFWIDLVFNIKQIKFKEEKANEHYVKKVA